MSCRIAQSYYVANFGKLRKEIKQRLDGKKGMERVIRSLDD
jgi:hypothetical protein